jgi:hypothetical protein
LPPQSKINYLMQGSNRPLQHLLHSTLAGFSFCCEFTSLRKLCKNAGPTIFLSQTSMSLCLFQCWAVLESWPGSRPGSHMRPVDIVDCQNPIENRPSVLTRTRSDCENQIFFVF